MELIETAKNALRLYRDNDVSEALRIMSKLHVEVYEGCDALKDMKHAQAHDLAQMVGNDFPHSPGSSAEPDFRMRQSFCSTAKAIEEILTDYLYN